MYDHIIVPMALDHGFAASALKLSDKLLNKGGRITALHVYEAPQGAVKAYLDADTVQKGHAKAEALLQERVAGAPNVTPVVVEGHSARMIMDYAASHDADCIVMGSHKPGLIDYLLGSTAARVVQHAPCAVHVMRDPG